MKTTCLAIVIDEEISFIGTLGKKRNIECCLPLTLIDPFTYKCEKGHIIKTGLYEVKGFIDFLSPQTLKELSE